VRFFDGAEREIEEVDVENLPSSLSEVMEQTDFEDNVGYHARGGGSQVGGAAMPKYHALGDNPEDYDDVELEHFARAVARAVDGHLAERAAPLVVAARPRLLGRLKQELRYRHVADADIQRDPASMTDGALHARAWAIAGPLLRRNREEVRARHRARLEGKDVSGSENLQELLRAADEGRIADLLIARGANVWGTYDEESREVEVADRSGPGNEDLLNLLAIKVLAQGGDVIAMPDDLSPQAGPAAGLFRF
jgi:protein required for attachment to host cells